MRTSLAVVVTATVAGLLVSADRAFAQQPGQLRVTMHLADSRSGVTYPAVKKTLTITGEAGVPVYRVETGRDGTIEITLPAGVYVVESAGPVPFQGRSYRWRTTVAVASGAVVVLELDERNGHSAPIPGRGPRIVPFAQYGAPQRLAGGLSVLVPIGRSDYQDGTLVARGIELQASGGRGGWRIATGYFEAGLPWGWTDVLVTMIRTTADPRGAFAASTYVGVEAGYTVVLCKVSVGFARRLDGPAETKRTMFTWSTGAHILFPFTF